jgi:hypothetical protein
MESAMLYRAELLLGLYAVTAGIYHAVPIAPMAVIPVTVSALTWWWSNGDIIFVVLILSLVANSVHWVVRWCLTRILARRTSVQQKKINITRRHAWLFMFIFLLLQFIAVLFGHIRNSSTVHLSPTPAIFVTLILFLPVVSASTTLVSEPRNVTFLSLLLPVWPFLVVGKLFMIAWNVVSEFPGDSMVDLPRFLWRVCLPVYLRSILCCRQRKGSPMQWRVITFLYILALFAHAPRMLQVGGGYVVGHFLSFVAWIEVLFCLLPIVESTSIVRP